MGDMHPKTLALLLAASLRRPPSVDWRADPFERAIGEWVEAGSPDVVWECDGDAHGSLTDAHNEHRQDRPGWSTGRHGFYKPKEGEE
mgnify:CR=1 FL=1